MPNIFSHPAYPVSDGYAVVGYNLAVSRAQGNTSVVTPVTTTGSQTVTPGSMTNIAVNAVLYIEPGTTQYEQVTVTAVTSTTFTTVFAKTHAGNFVVQSTIISPAFYGPWSTIVSNYTNNLSVIDMGGSKFDLYRVQPIVQLNPTGTSPGPQIAMDFSRAFYASTDLYDAQISSIIENFRNNYLDDPGTKQTDSTDPTESTGQGVMPFITDASTPRFYLSFIPNADPVKFRDIDVSIYYASNGNSSSVAPMVPYTDYFPNGPAGYIDFKNNPVASSYLRVEYTSYIYGDDQVRSALTNAISELSLFGLTDQTYQINTSNNYHYLVQALPNQDVAQIVCAIAQKNILGSKIQSSFQSSEAWKNGKIEWTADPSRSIQAGTLWHKSLRDQIQLMANSYIQNTRVYFSRGEFDSFFDNAGILYPPFSIYNVFNYMSWWL